MSISRSSSELYPPGGLQGMGREAREVDFSAQLPQLAIPVTLFAGRNPESMIPSDISDE